MAFDYKKEYKEFYLPPKKPTIIEVPEMTFLAVRGHGDPNEEGGAYKDALEALYGVAYTIKMSKKVTTASRDTSTSWFRRWRASGGRTVCWAWITLTRRISTGSRSFVFPSS